MKVEPEATDDKDAVVFKSQRFDLHPAPPIPAQKPRSRTHPIYATPQKGKSSREEDDATTTPSTKDLADRRSDDDDDDEEAGKRLSAPRLSLSPILPGSGGEGWRDSQGPTTREDGFTSTWRDGKEEEEEQEEEEQEEDKKKKKGRRGYWLKGLHIVTVFKRVFILSSLPPRHAQVWKCGEFDERFGGTSSGKRGLEAGIGLTQSSRQLPPTSATSASKCCEGSPWR